MLIDDLLIVFNRLYIQQNILICKRCFYACLVWVFVAFALFWPADVTSVWRFEYFETVNHFTNQLAQMICLWLAHKMGWF